MNDLNVKLIAFHLPQFHEFPENNKWWGQGFTEWTNVKKAKALYRGHNQPRIPENENYYNLLDEISLQNQMNLAKRSGLYGFCFYHYWFDGKLLMEKPLERLLTLKEKINYCFCWANEPWTRAWDGITSEILMPQKYGGRAEWEEHLRYLLSFFKDDFYIKIDNKPVLVIYRTNNIPQCDDMIRYWDIRCRELGFEGIYVIEERNSYQSQPECSNSNAVLEFEPMYTIRYGRPILRRFIDKIRMQIFNCITKHQMQMYSYDEVWKMMIRRRHMLISGKKQFLGAFPDWDNTPRRGGKGTVLFGSSPEKFKEYMKRQMEHARKEESEYLFINAWNEWGESAYLEPDSRHGSSYLNVIRELF